MVREGAFDAGELAIVTYMQALDYGKPLVLLPAVMVGRFQHQFFVCRKERRRWTRRRWKASGRGALLYADDGRVGARHPAG
jgi:hypothetical protein